MMEGKERRGRWRWEMGMQREREGRRGRRGLGEEKGTEEEGEER